MSIHSDLHLRKQEEFDHQGNTVKIGGEVYVACTVIGAPPHNSCPFYQTSAARNEKLYKEKLIEGGEFGAREDLGRARLGFQFAGVQVKEVKRKPVKKDTDEQKVVKRKTVKKDTVQE